MKLLVDENDAHMITLENSSTYRSKLNSLCSIVELNVGASNTSLHTGKAYIQYFKQGANSSSARYYWVGPTVSDNSEIQFAETDCLNKNRK